METQPTTGYRIFFGNPCADSKIAFEGIGKIFCRGKTEFDGDFADGNFRFGKKGGSHGHAGLYPFLYVCFPIEFLDETLGLAI